MKRLLASILVLLLIISSFLFIKFNNKTKETVKQKNQNYEFDCILTEGAMNTISVKTSKGVIYSFLTEDVDMSEVDGLIIGKKLHIKYYGILDKKKDFQDGKIVKIYSIEDKKVELPKQEINSYPTAWNDEGIFSDYYEKAYEKLETMTIDEKVGQLLLARVPSSNQVNDIKTYHLGGYILFGRDTKGKTKSQLINTIKSYQEASSIPLIISTDEEGGDVVRISSNSKLTSSRFKSSQQLYKEGGFNLIKEDTISKSNILYNLGINTNLAPVADVSTNSSDYMYSRAFGKNAKETSTYIKTVIEASKDTKVSYVLKHFPGYGNNVNTHTGIAIDKRSYTNFENNDFLPFKAGIDNGGEAILVSHNIVNCMDSKNPASLSIAVHNILREDLGFTGIIMTDDLAMDAVKDYVEDPFVKAILSGNDLLIVSDHKKAFNSIKASIDNKTISEDLINQLVFKVLAWKYYKGLM